MAHRDQRAEDTGVVELRSLGVDDRPQERELLARCALLVHEELRVCAQDVSAGDCERLPRLETVHGSRPEHELPPVEQGGLQA